MTDESLINARLALPLADNYYQLGSELIHDREFAEEPTRDDLIRKARNWLAILSTKIKKVLCSNSRVKELFNNPSTNRQVLLVAAIADLVSAMVAPASPWTVSVLLVQEGLVKLCPDLEQVEKGPQ